MKRKFVLILLTILLILIAFQKSIITNLQALLLISQEFPQIPVKPLHSLTKAPTHQKIKLDSPNGPIVADLFIPHDSKPQSKPALILAMGVKTNQKDQVVILDFADSLSRLGYVVLWPRLEILDKGVSDFEKPTTFVTSFRYLENLQNVNKKRISFVGFSVGSSIAFVAATDPQIAAKPRALVFFGGYFDIFEYLNNLATQSITINAQKVSWQPDQSATNHVKEILDTNQSQLAQIFEDDKSTKTIDEILRSLPENEIDNFKDLSPKEMIDNYKTPTFILHEKSDTFVLYTQSIALKDSLPHNLQKAYLITNLFEHVQPQKGTSPKILGEIAKLYIFLYKTLYFLDS